MRRGNQRGQAITETAMVVPLFALLFLGVFIAGAFVTVRVSAVNSARQGARMASLLGGQGQTLSQTQVDQRIVDAVLTAAKLPNSKITEIDIYCHLGTKCANTVTTVDGTFVTSDDYDKFTVTTDSAGVSTATAVAAQQSFTLDKRTQVPPDEVSIGVRIVYTYTSPVSVGIFAGFTRTMEDYSVMKASAVLV